MDGYYYHGTQNWLENDEPLNEPPIPLKKNFFFYLIQLIFHHLLKTFENITLRKIAFHPSNYEEISKILS